MPGDALENLIFQGPQDGGWFFGLGVSRGDLDGKQLVNTFCK